MKKTAALMLAALLACGGTFCEAATQEIVVSGKGEVAAAADCFSFYAEMISHGKSEADAAAENAARMKKVRTALIAAGAEASRLSTESFSVSPEYKSDGKGNRKLVGYIAESSLDVTVLDLARAGAVVDAATRNGADRVAGIRFLTEDRTPYEDEAYRAAAADANEKATAAAEQLGLPRGMVLAAEDASDMSPRFHAVMLARAANAEADAATQMLAGEESVTAGLSVTYGVPDAETVRKISAEGVGTVTETADMAELSIVTEGEAETASKASAVNAARAEKVLSALLSAGVPQNRISTTGYSLYQSGGKKKGYTVRNTLRVRLSDVSRAGAVADAAIQAGATSVGGVEFSYSEAAKFRAQSVSRAVAAAKKRAEVIAAGLGCTLGEVRSVTITETGTNNYGGALYKAMGTDGGAAVTEITPPRQDITSRVIVEFGIL